MTEFSLPFSGKSMLPTLKEGDELNIKKINIGDILLFKDKKQFVVHRLLSKDPMTTKGNFAMYSEAIPQR